MQFASLLASIPPHSTASFSSKQKTISDVFSATSDKHYSYTERNSTRTRDVHGSVSAAVPLHGIPISGSLAAGYKSTHGDIFSSSTAFDLGSVSRALSHDEKSQAITVVAGEFHMLAYTISSLESVAVTNGKDQVEFVNRIIGAPQFAIKPLAEMQFGSNVLLDSTFDGISAFADHKTQFVGVPQHLICDLPDTWFSVNEAVARNASNWLVMTACGSMRIVENPYTAADRYVLTVIDATGMGYQSRYPNLIWQLNELGGFNVAARINDKDKVFLYSTSMMQASPRLNIDDNCRLWVYGNDQSDKRRGWQRRAVPQMRLVPASGDNCRIQHAVFIREVDLGSCNVLDQTSRLPCTPLSYPVWNENTDLSSWHRVANGGAPAGTLTCAVPVVRATGDFDRVKSFYCSQLGFSLVNPDSCCTGKWFHAVFKRDNAVVHVSSYGDIASKCTIVIDCDDVNAVYDAWYSKIHPDGPGWFKKHPTDEDWGRREMWVVDPWNNTLRISSHKRK